MKSRQHRTAEPAAPAPAARQAQAPAGMATSPRQLAQSEQMARLRFAAAPVAQRRRAPHPEEIRQHLNTSHDDADDDEVAVPRSADTVNASWLRSYQSGRQIMQKGLDWLNRAATALPPRSTEQTAAALDAKGYKNFWRPDANGSVEVRTHRGEEVEQMESAAVDAFALGDDQDYFYSNEYRGATGEFYANVNYRKPDQDLATEAGLPEAARNSEMIWNQYSIARQALIEASPPEAAPPSRLKNISRNAISNTQTLDTIFLCDGGARAAAGETVTIADPTEDAIALLGTPNGNSAAYVLIEHGHEFGGQDIESISYSKDFLNIRYVTA